MTLFKKLFRREMPPTPQPLSIEGTNTRNTPEPDDAELAAQAVLEMMSALSNRNARSNQGNRNAQSDQSNERTQSAGYYRQLADRIREAHIRAVQQATRFIYNCELMLQNKHLPLYGEKSLQMLEVELYKRIDVVEREGGELKTRWQHCLAEVTVRLMNDTTPEEKPHTDYTEKKNGAQKA